MKKIFLLLKNQFLEFSYEKLTTIPFALALVLLLISIVLGGMTIAERQKILIEFGFFGAHIMGVFYSVFVASFLLDREIKRQTCLLVLVRPVSRGEFLVSKFLSIISFTFFGMLALILILSVLLKFDFNLLNMLGILLMITVEISILTAASLFFGVWMMPASAAICSFGIYLIGHWMQEIEFYGKKADLEWFIKVYEILKWICPHLYQFNFRNEYFLINGVQSESVAWGLLHGASWVVLFLSLAILIFKKKDLVA